MEEITQPQVTESETAAPQAEQAEPTAATEQATPQAEELKVKYKFNHEEVEEVYDPSVYQKGKNYDKIHEQLENSKTKIDQYENSKSNQLLQDMAADRGVTVEQLVDAMEASRLSKKAQEKGLTVEQFKQQQTEAADRVKNDTELARLKKFEADTLAQQEAEQAANAEITAFREANPDVKQINPEVLQKWQNGVPLQEAQDMVTAQKRIVELEKQLGIKTVNDENAEASTGKLGGGAEHEPELTAEMIAKMSPAEQTKNHARIWEFLTGSKN